MQLNAMQLNAMQLNAGFVFTLETALRHPHISTLSFQEMNESMAIDANASRNPNQTPTPTGASTCSNLSISCTTIPFLPTTTSALSLQPLLAS